MELWGKNNVNTAKSVICYLFQIFFDESFAHSWRSLGQLHQAVKYNVKLPLQCQTANVLF